jgi:hypothetical protein
LKGKDLNLVVHQHLGYKLQFEWKSKQKCMIKEKGIDVFPAMVVIFPSAKKS